MTVIGRAFLLAGATISCLLLGSVGANEHRVRGSKRAVVESTTTTTIDRDDDKRRLLVANSLVDVSACTIVSVCVQFSSFSNFTRTF